MHIAIDARFYGLEHAGLGRYTQNLIQELATIDTENIYTLFVWDAHKDLQLPANFKTLVVDAPHHSFQEQFGLAKILWQGDFDLVHFPHFIVPVLNFRVPFVVTIHDLIKHKHGGMEATTLAPWKYRFKYLAYKFDMWWAAKLSTHIITPTQAVKDDVVSWFSLNPDKITYTHEGFDSELRTSLDNSQANPQQTLQKYGISQPYILYVGNSYPYKNIETLLQSLDYLPENMKLVLVGSRNVFVDRVTARIKELGKENRVIQAGYVPDNDLGVLYNHAVAMTTATLEEGFGITPLEAMGAGCPAIISDIPVFREVCEDAAMYFNPKEVQGLASRVMELHENEQQRQEYIQKGYEQVQKFSWNRMARETLAVYKTIGKNNQK